MYAERNNETEVRDLASAIYRENAGFLFALAMQNARNEADAEEAISEALISFLRSYEVGGPAPPLPWLILTLKRQCWRQKRDAHLERQVGQEAQRGDDARGTVIESLRSPGTDFETRIADTDEARCRLAELKTDERTALGAFAAGFSYKEIASRLRWTYTKVDRCIREGRTALAAA
jgi:DNA-directed RNA polymerase specialized sigma24 family protein